jgi:hypothetical protein
MREKLLSIGDDFWIENDESERACKVNGKALRLRQTFVLENAAGNEVARIQERKLSIRDKIAIEREGHPSSSAAAEASRAPRRGPRGARSSGPRRRRDAAAIPPEFGQPGPRSGKDRAKTAESRRCASGARSPETKKPAHVRGVSEWS